MTMAIAMAIAMTIASATKFIVCILQAITLLAAIVLWAHILRAWEASDDYAQRQNDEYLFTELFRRLRACLV